MNKNIQWHFHRISKDERSKQKLQRPCVIWFTGLSGSGKSTIASFLEQKLFEKGHHTYMLDGDNIRFGLNKDLTFTDADRMENIRRVGEVAKLMVDAGLIVISAFISPFREEREMVRSLFQQDEFIEIYMDASLEECEKRDPKGLYKKARKGLISNFTGIDSSYEEPLMPELRVNTVKNDIPECVSNILSLLKDDKYI
jgi:adenylyl-sulfate kinase